MAQLYPDAVRDITLNTIDQNSGVTSSLNVPPQQNFDTPAMQGSLQQALSENLGQFVVVEFLMGTNAMVQKSGILYSVGTSVVTLYDETTQTFVVCDIFSVKFVTFYLPGRRPQRYVGPYVAPYSMASAGTTPYGPVHQTPNAGVSLSGIPGVPNTTGLMGGI